jgi:hypothetical protein
MTATRHEIRPQVVSGRPGIKETRAGVHERWSAKELAMTLDPSLDALGPQAKDAVRTAVGSWMSSVDALPRVRFEVGGEHAAAVRDGVNRVVLAPIELAGHERDLAVTIGYADVDSGVIVEADVVFNADYSFVTGTGKCTHDYDLTSVATHEMGHFFGLGDDMTDETTTMYFRTGRCETHKRILADADREVITSLYEEPEAPPEDATSNRGCGGGE